MSDAVSFSFDIGHASIGWAALAADGKVLGCGSVIFPKEDCQNFARAGLRRQRRHVAATRNRMKRLRQLFVEKGVLTVQEAYEQAQPSSGVMMPWLLAAQALEKGRQLTWRELWQVIRWYAHNRGYDGNAEWAGDGPTAEDTEKVQNAKQMMEDSGADSMAVAICRFLEVDLETGVLHGDKYFKGQNVAFPRETVRGEVRTILTQAESYLPGCDVTFIRMVMDELSPEEAKRFGLPERYRGGLLFGQMIPRFDNRIISTCPISGEKTPLKHCPEYYRYRWAELMANLAVEVDGVKRPLLPREREALHACMTEQGYLTKGQLKKALEEITGGSAKQVDDYFLHAEMEKALVLDPVRKEVTGSKLGPIWQTLSSKHQKIFANQFFRDGKIKLEDWRARLLKDGEDVSAFDAAVEEVVAQTKPRGKRKAEPLTVDALMTQVHRLGAAASGRAPYSRQLMQQAVEEVMAGLHPKAVKSDDPSNPQQRNGCLARTNEILERERGRRLDEQTNNHLVRHRMLMFRRLLEDLYQQYAGGDIRRVGPTTIEVARDMVEYSGMSAQDKAKLFGQKVAPFNRAEKYLREAFEDADIFKPITYNMIRKARIAMAQNWVCPYTGRSFGPQEIAYDQVDFEHIVPRSQKISDSLDGLVITFREVNKMKGNRLALDFVRQCAGTSVAVVYEDENSEIVSEKRFRQIVDGWYPKRDPRSLPNATDEDFIRWRRKQNLLRETYDEKDNDFTPRLLTFTSHLNKLAALEARKFWHAEAAKVDALRQVEPEHLVGHMQGSVTHRFRSDWKLLGCLAEVCPEVVEKVGDDSRLLPKAQIREITHLHHAVDAVAIGLTRQCFARLGYPVLEREKCQTILKRKASNNDERDWLASLGIFQFDHQGRHHLKPLDEDIRASLIAALAQKRVVQHVPASMSGLKVEQTQWRVLHGPDGDGKLTLRQRGPRENGHRRFKEAKEASSRVLGFAPTREESKLKPRQAGIVISENFGAAISDAGATVIPFHRVWNRLQELKGADGKPPLVIRRGQVIQVANGRYKGLWRIHSVKDNKTGVSLDMARPELVKAENKKAGCGMNVRLASLVKNGLRQYETTLTGDPM